MEERLHSEASLIGDLQLEAPEDEVPRPLNDRWTTLLWVQQLVEMGFRPQAAEMAIQESHAENLEEAVEFLTNRSRTWSHAFLRKIYIAGEGEESGNCVVCGGTQDVHVELEIDSSPSILLSPRPLASPRSPILLEFLRSQLSIRRASTLSVPEELCLACLQTITEKWSARNCSVHNFCKACAVAYVEEKVWEGQDIYCLSHDCQSILTIEEIRDLVGNEKTEMWVRKRYEHNPNYRHCPEHDCPGYLLTTPQTTEVQCPICHTQLCSHCGRAWHAPSTCETVSRTELHESLEVKACPGCQRFIEKNKGCDHMTCRLCLHEWCWQCLQPYTNTHLLSESPDYCLVLRNQRSPAVLRDEILELQIRRYMEEREIRAAWEVGEVSEVTVFVSLCKIFCTIGSVCVLLPLSIVLFAMLTPLCYLSWGCVSVWFVLLKWERRCPFLKICLGVALWPIAPLFLAGWIVVYINIACVSKYLQVLTD